MLGRAGCLNAIRETYSGTKGNDFQNTFHEEECGEHNIQVLQDCIIRQRGPMILETHRENSEANGCTRTLPMLREEEEACTFIIRTMVLSAMRAMILYSNGGDTTNCHIRY